MRKQIVVLLASLAILPLASCSNVSHLRGVVSAEGGSHTASPSTSYTNPSLLGTNLRLKYPSLEVMILMACQPSIIKEIRSSAFQKLLQEANLPADVLEMMQEVYFPKHISGAPTSQQVKAALSSSEYQELLRDPDFTVFIGSPNVAAKFMQHFTSTTKAGDIIAMASKKIMIDFIRKTNFFQHMEHLGLSHQLAEILTEVFFPEDGKAPSSEEVKVALSKPLVKAVLQSSEFQTVLRSKDVIKPIPKYFKPVESVAEFINIYSDPAVVKEVQSDAFKQLLREAGMSERVLQKFLAIYNIKDEEIEDGKSLSDYVKEQLSTPTFRYILASPDFRSIIFSAQVVDFIMPHYLLAKE